jgi:hypothetical protein
VNAASSLLGGAVVALKARAPSVDFLVDLARDADPAGLGDALEAHPLSSPPRRLAESLAVSFGRERGRPQGLYSVRCIVCGINVAITTAGPTG